jgi:hypothetical protein
LLKESLYFQVRGSQKPVKPAPTSLPGLISSSASSVAGKIAPLPIQAKRFRSTNRTRRKQLIYFAFNLKFTNTNLLINESGHELPFCIPERNKAI